MNVSCSCSSPPWQEVQIAMSAKEFCQLGERLLSIKEEESIELLSKGGVYKNYQEEIECSRFIRKNGGVKAGFIQVDLEQDHHYTLRFESDNEGFTKLGKSLINFFSGEVLVNSHFHLDSYDGNGLLLSTNVSLIFLAVS